MSTARDPRFDRACAFQRSYSALQQDLASLDERISLLRAVVAESVDDAPGQPVAASLILAQCLHYLGTSLYERFLHTREVADLEEAEDHLRLVVHDPLLKASFPGPHTILGSVLRERAYEASIAHLAEEALSLHREPFLADRDISTHEEAYHSRELGLTLRTYSKVTRYSDDHEKNLSEAIARLKHSQALFTDMGLPDHLSSFGLCAALHSLYELKSEKVYLEDAVSFGKRAVELCGPMHRDFFRVCWMSSFTRYIFAWFFGDFEALEEAIETLRGALAGAPPIWARQLTITLSDTLHLRFVEQGHEEGLSEAISRLNTVLTGLGSEELLWGRLQSSLSSMLLRRFRVTGVPDDMDAAVHAAGLALSRTSGGTSTHLDLLNKFALCRAEQAKVFGDIDHVNESISLLQQTRALSPLNSMVSRLGAVLLIELFEMRYEATGDLVDLDAAVDLAQPFVETLGKKDVNAGRYLCTVGNAYLSRFEAIGAAEDLTQAAALLKEAAETFLRLPDTLYSSWEILYKYATILRIRYEVFRESESATTALQLYQDAIKGLPPSSPYYTRVLCGLARLRLCTSLGPYDINEALAHLLYATTNNSWTTYDRLREVSSVLAYITTAMPPFDHGNALKLSVAYARVIDLLPQVASFGLEPRNRLSAITDAGRLTAHGAHHAISIGQADVALEMLEAGRNVFWAQGLRLRTPFTDLPDALGDRLTGITQALAQPMSNIREGPDKDRELARRRRLGDDFQSVLAEARAVPGFEDLLQNVTFAALSQAAKRHPIVVLVAGERCGHAIILMDSEELRVVTLAQATVKVLRELSHKLKAHTGTIRSSRGVRKVQASKSYLTDVYRELWTSVMLPIVDTLRWPKASGRDRPRLTLCPTGVFMQLPLHAAGIHAGEDQVSCSDYFVSSYTPSIAALLHAQQASTPVRRSDAETLLVAVDDPFQGSALPNTVEEAGIVRGHVSPVSKVVEASSQDDVLKCIQSASILHLACHGTQNLSDALQSGFYLQDGLLVVSKLIELDLPRAFLAVLSACETAKGDAAQPDQAIHLAAAMMFAGFKSVVATMWFMGDSEGPIVAEQIYSALFTPNAQSEYLDPEDVPYALDDAIQMLRTSGLDPSFWGTYVHIGI